MSLHGVHPTIRHTGTLAFMAFMLRLVSSFHMFMHVKGGHITTMEVTPYSSHTVCGFYKVTSPTVLINRRGCEIGPTVYGPYPRKLVDIFDLT